MKGSKWRDRAGRRIRFCHTATERSTSRLGWNLPVLPEGGNGLVAAESRPSWVGLRGSHRESTETSSPRPSLAQLQTQRLLTEAPVLPLPFARTD